MAAREAGDERLLGIDAGLAALIGEVRRGPDRDPGIEGPVVVPVIGWYANPGVSRRQSIVTVCSDMICPPESKCSLFTLGADFQCR